MRDYTRVYKSSEEWNYFKNKFVIYVLKIPVSNFLFPLHRIWDCRVLRRTSFSLGFLQAASYLLWQLEFLVLLQCTAGG
jgi:hypothetical protein